MEVQDGKPVEQVNADNVRVRIFRRVGCRNFDVAGQCVVPRRKLEM